MNITRRLTHVCTWQGVTKNAYGDRVDVSTVCTIACYAYQGTERETASGYVQASPIYWNVILPSSITFVQEGDLLVDIRDAGDHSLLAQGRIKSVQIFGRYRAKNREFHLATLEVN